MTAISTHGAEAIPRQSTRARVLDLLSATAVICLAASIVFDAFERWLPSIVAATLSLPYHWLFGLAIVVDARAATEAETPRERRAWWLLAFATSGVPLAALLRYRLAIADGEPLHLALDLLLVAFYPITIAALTELLSMGRTRVGDLRKLEFAAAAVSLLTIAAFLWRHAIEIAGSAQHDVYDDVAPVVGGVTAVALALLLIARSGEKRPRWINLLSAAVIVAAVTDMATAIVAVRTMRVSDGGWAIAACLFALAAIERLRERSVVRLEPVSPRPLRGTAIVSYVATSALAGVTVWELVQSRRTSDALLATGVAMVVILVTASQYLGVQRILRLSRDRARQDARFRALVERSPDAFLLLDPSARVLYASEAASRLFGIDASAADASFHALAGTIGGFDARAFLADVHAAGGAPRTATVTDEERTITLLGIDRLQDPDVGGIVVNARDVSAEHLLEERLERSRRTETLARLAGGVAHDFNNVLTSIIGYTESVEATLAPEHPVTGDVREIRRAADSAAGLTRQLLAYARGGTARPRSIPLDRAVQDTVRLLRGLVGKDVTLHLELTTSDAHVLIDPSQLEQVLLNLAMNARDAMPSGGSLTVRTARDPATDEHEARVLLAVRDTGVGMDAPTMRRIFEPLFTTKRHGLGTGLGLAAVQAIVEQAGGEVQVNSEPGRGSEFLVMLPETAPPVRDGDAAVASPVVARTESPSETRVLLVDDETTVRGLARRALERAGYRVTEAGDGESALALYDRAPHFDLIVTDIRMPNMSGVELATALRSRDASLRVLFISGFADSRDIGGSGDQVVDLLQKPFTPKMLVARVQAALERTRKREASEERTSVSP